MKYEVVYRYPNGNNAVDEITADEVEVSTEGASARFYDRKPDEPGRVEIAVFMQVVKVSRK